MKNYLYDSNHVRYELCSNIELLFIEDAGHMIWVENPAKAKEAFEKMILRLK